MNYEELISEANLAFVGNQFEVSLNKAQEAINTIRGRFRDRVIVQSWNRPLIVP